MRQLTLRPQNRGRLLLSFRRNRLTYSYRQLSSRPYTLSSVRGALYSRAFLMSFKLAAKTQNISFILLFQRTQAQNEAANIRVQESIVLSNLVLCIEMLYFASVRTCLLVLIIPSTLLSYVFLRIILYSYVKGSMYAAALCFSPLTSRVNLVISSTRLTYLPTLFTVIGAILMRRRLLRYTIL